MDLYGVYRCPNPLISLDLNSNIHCDLARWRLLYGELIKKDLSRTGIVSLEACDLAERRGDWETRQSIRLMKNWQAAFTRQMTL